MEEDVEILDSVCLEKTCLKDEKTTAAVQSQHKHLEAQWQDCLQPRVFLLNPIIVILMDVRGNS